MTYRDLAERLTVGTGRLFRTDEELSSKPISLESIGTMSVREFLEELESKSYFWVDSESDSLVRLRSPETRPIVAPQVENLTGLDAPWKGSFDLDYTLGEACETLTVTGRIPVIPDPNVEGLDLESKPTEAATVRDVLNWLARTHAVAWSLEQGSIRVVSASAPEK